MIEDPGQLVVGGQTFTNAGEAANGTVSLVSALEVSSDVYFYTLGLRMWDKGYLQQWAHKLGIGRDPGIDLPGAAKGLLPTQQWRNKLAAEGELEGRPWSAGDNVQLATGQGDLQTNPLQLAIAYATLGNGGTVVTPHVGKEIDDSAGRVLHEFDPGPQRHVHIDPTYRADDPRRPPRRRPERRRHLLRRLRQLPDRSRRQDRDGAATAVRGPVLVRGPGALPGPEDRHRRDHGGRRLRRRIGGPGGAHDPRSVFRQAPDHGNARSAKKAKKKKRAAG